MAQALMCSLCDGGHLTKNCSFPQEIVRCNGCKLPIFDLEKHDCDTNCIPKSFYTDIFAKEALTLFRFAYSGDFYFLDEKNEFHRLCHDQKLICGAIDGMFTVASIERHSSIFYDSIALKKFSFLFAILRNNTWQLWLRAVVSPSHGLQLFRLDHSFGPIMLPPEFKLNTVAVFGIVPSPDADRIQISFSVYADSVDCDIRTGYCGSVEWPNYPADPNEVNRLNFIYNLQKIFPKQNELNQFNLLCLGIFALCFR